MKDERHRFLVFQCFSLTLKLNVSGTCLEISANYIDFYCKAKRTVDLKGFARDTGEVQRERLGAELYFRGGPKVGSVAFL